MLNEVFVQLLRQSAAGAIIVLVLLPVCTLLRRMGTPRRLCCLLWAAVPLRLLFPALLRVSLPRTVAAPSGMVQAVQLAGETMQELGQNAAAQPVAFSWVALLAAVWALGVILLLANSLRRTILLRRTVKNAQFNAEENCWQCGLPSAFVWGVFCPRIFVPEGLSVRQRRIVLLHERSHLHCGDHWFKAIFWLTACLHWFNPLVWLAFSCLSRDLEAACDEAVLHALGTDAKAEYCQSLLDLASGKIPGVETAFGGGNVKERIAHILGWKKPARTVTVCGVLACAMLFGVCLAKPVLAENIFEAAPAQSESFATGENPDGTVNQGENNTSASLTEKIAMQAGPGQNTPSAQLMNDADARADAEVQAAKDAALFLWPVPEYRYVARWMGTGKLEETADGTAVSGSVHHGSDLVAEKGASILAMADATVQEAGWHDSYGWYVVLSHESGYQTLYAHCDKIDVQAGETVAQGQKIATVGNSGNSTGDHCHVECFLNGVRFNLQAIFPNRQ